MHSGAHRRAGWNLRPHFPVACFILNLLVLMHPERVKAGEFWQSLGGPTGGTVSVLARDPVSGTLYAGTGYQHGYNKNAGSVFRSNDNGDSWTYISQDFFTLTQPINTRVRALAVNSQGHVFAGLEIGGVMRSTNGGTSWSRIVSGLGDFRIRDLEISSLNELYAATDTVGVWSFNSANSTWSSLNDGLNSLDTRSILIRNGYLIVGTQTGGVFKRPTGQPWSAASSGLSSLRINGLSQSSVSGAMFACTDTGILSSVDDAASWQPVGGPFSQTICWSVLDEGCCLLAGTNIGLFRSIDGGANWAQVSGGFTGANARVLMDGAAGRIFAGSFDNGLFRSDDTGQNWSRANNGLYGYTVVRLCVARDGQVLAGTITNGIHKSTLYGGAWSEPILAGWHMFALAESPWGDLFAGNYNITNGVPDGHAWRSGDGGDNWTALDTGLSASMISGFAFPGGDQVLCTSSWNPGGVSQSANRGDFWTRLGPPQNTSAYCLTRSAQGDLFFGSEGSNVWRYNNGSGTWSNLGLSQSQQFSIAINSEGHVFVGNDGNIKGVYKSTANGDSLQPLANFPGNYGYAICILPDDDMYVGTRDNGIQYSHDGGATWMTVNSGIPVSSCQAISIGPDGYLYAGVAGFGVYRSTSAVVPQLPGDIDGDGDVDEEDIALFAGVLTGEDQMPVRRFRSDLNSDTVADGEDIGSFVDAYLAPP